MKRRLWNAALAGLTVLTFVGTGVVGAFAEQGQGKGQQQGKGNSEQKGQSQGQEQGKGNSEQKGQAKGQQQGKGYSEQAPKGKGYAKGQRPGFYPGITQNPWFSHTAIRQELRLTDEQFANLNKAWARSWSDFQTGATGLSDEQYAKRMTELTIKFNQSFDQYLKSMLTTEQQISRYNQLSFQRGGFSFLDNTDILTQLSLNQQQLTLIQNAQAQFNTNVIDWSDPQQGMSSYYSQLSKVYETVNGILTQEQRLTWDRLFGQPFNFLVNVNANANGNAYAKGQRPGFYPGITQNPWFSNVAIRQELRLTDEQFANLNKAWARSWSDFQTGATGLSDEQYAKRMADLTIKFNQSFDQYLKSILTEQQISRYNQLSFQRGGFSFLDNTDILTQLSLNQQQLTLIQNAQAQFNTNVIDWSDPQQGMSSYYSQLSKVYETVNGILTQEQRLTWDRLFGQPFSFSVNANTAVPGGVNGTVQGNATVPGVVNGTVLGNATVSGTIQTTGNLHVPGTLHQIPGSIPNAATSSVNLGLGMSGQAGFNQGNYGRYGWYPGRWLFRGRR